MGIRKFIPPNRIPDDVLTCGVTAFSAMGCRALGEGAVEPADGGIGSSKPASIARRFPRRAAGRMLHPRSAGAPVFFTTQNRLVSSGKPCADHD
jgi:hypothetical protein